MNKIRALRTLNRRASGIKSTMTSTEFSTFLGYYANDVLDLRNCNISVTSQINTTGKNWWIRGGTFTPVDGTFSKAGYILNFSASHGTDNAILNAYQNYNLGSVSSGTTVIPCASAIAVGLYCAYGDNPSNDRCVHRDSSASWHYYKGEVVNVITSNGTSIVLEEPLIDTYGTLKLSNIYPVMQNFKIEGTTFNALTSSNTSGCSKCLAFGPVKNASILDTYYNGFGTSAFFCSFGRGVSITNYRSLTDLGAGRYGIELSRCVGSHITDSHSGIGRWGVTGQGNKSLLARDSYFWYGADGDHGLGGKNIMFLRCAADGASGTWLAGNPSWHVGTDVTWKDMTHKHPDTHNGTSNWYVYGNSNGLFINCQLNEIKCRTYSSINSNITGVLNPGPVSIILASGTVVQRGAYIAYTTPGHNNGNYAMQHAFDDAYGAAGSKLSYFELDSTSQMLCWTFGPPITMHGVTSVCTSIIRGTLGVNWDNSSVPCIYTNGGTHIVNVSGMRLLSSKPTLPSQSTDIANFAAGTTSANITLGTITVQWAASSQLETAASGRVNNGIGGSLIIQ